MKKRLRALAALILPITVILTMSAIAASAGVTVSSPASGATVNSPVHFVAAASSWRPITYMRIYVDGKSVFGQATKSLDTYVTMSNGTHYCVVQAWDSSGAVFKTSVSINVGSTTASSVTVTSPSSGATVSSPAHFVASATSSYPVTAMRIYVDSVNTYTVASNRLDTYVNASPGTHSAVVQAWNSQGAVFSRSLSFTVPSSTTTSPTPTPTPTPTPAPSDPYASYKQYYVSTSGSDSNDGSASRPWKTINHAASTVSAGSEIHVAAGTYSGAVTTSKSGSSDTARIRFISDTKWGAKIVNSSTDTVWTNNGNYVDIVGFDVSGTGRLGILNNGSYVRVIANNVHNIAGTCNSNGGAGIDHANYSAHDNDTIANVVHDIGNPAVSCSSIQGIYHSNLRGKILNNISYRNQGWGIHLWHAPQQVTISGNLVFQNGIGGILVGAGDSPGGVSADGMVVTNNIVIYNNSSWGAGIGIDEYGTVGANNYYENNVLYGNKTNVNLLGGKTARNTIASDPKLVNYKADGTGDYHLTSVSPALDAGTIDGAATIDYDGGSRPVGKATDIGPYEYGAAAKAWPNQ